jgi:group I intron endonuclease
MTRPLGIYPFPYDTRAGVYQIENKLSGVVYIGSAINFYRRWRRHHNELTRGVHSNQHLQRAWDKYGPDSFIWTVLEETNCTRETLLSREQYWMDRIKKEGVLLYNTCVTAGSHLGVKRSEKTRKLMSEIAKKRGDNGIRRDEEWCRQVSEANKNNVETRCDAKFREKMSKLKIGNMYCKGKKWINKNGCSKRVSLEELPLFLEQGWKKGRATIVILPPEK